MNVIEIDAASNNGVDNIREIREEVAYRPTEGKYKVYIIDEVHMLSTGAFNALLKTLEEPPSYVIFILATTEAHKIPITILSRCQRYDFHRISIDTIAARLSELLTAEGVEAEEKAVRYVAKKGDGSMRDALSLLDQCISFYLGQVLTYDKVLDVLGAVDTEVFSRLLRKVLSGDVTGSIHVLEDLITGGRELGQFVSDFTWYMRNLLLVKTSENPEEAIDVSSENLKLLKEESGMTDVETLMRYIRIFSDLSNQIRFASQKRVLVEIALIKLCRPAMETNLDSVLDRLRVLEKQMEERPVQQVIVRESEAGGTGEPGAAVTGTATVQQQKPQKAAPEDLQKIVAGWRAIVGQTTGLFKQSLQRAVPKYNGETGDPILYVEFQDFLGMNYVDNPEAKKELQDIIAARTGKSVEIHMLVANKHQHTNLAQITVDDALRENIHMDIVVEEDPDEEYKSVNKKQEESIMAKRGGFPGMGMPGNMNNLMKQAQKMQRQMEENQKALEEKEFTATVGGGAVSVTVSGKREITKVTLSEEAVDPDDIEMLEDMIAAATNEALRQVESESAAVMSKLTGGLGGLGGGLPF